MKRIDKMPEVPEIKTCVKHGDYEVKYQALINKIYVYDHCMTCASEKSEKERVERLEKEKKQNEEREKSRRERVRVTAGISKRNIYVRIPNQKRSYSHLPLSTCQYNAHQLLF